LESNSPVQQEVERLNTLVRRLVRSFPTAPEIAQLGRVARDFENLPLAPDTIEHLRGASETLKNVHRSGDALEVIRRTLADLYAVRNAAAHGLSSAPADTARPAYSLGEDDHG
jgi:hypothetical protein